MLKKINIFLITVFFIVSLCAQDLPYGITTDGLKSINLRLMDDTPLSVSRLDSVMQKGAMQMPFSYKMQKLEKAFQTYAETELHPITFNIGQYPYISTSGTNYFLDANARFYDGYKFAFEFDHGYFGHVKRPYYRRNIKKSIYRDLLYPWQNAPQRKFQDYKALHLILNYVYPTD